MMVPQLRTADPSNGDSERHASNLELFFDLVFVVAVGALAEGLTGDPSPFGFLHYAALFVPVWWAWVGYCFYADRFESDDAVHRLMTLAAMLAVTALAVSIPGAFSGHSGAVRFAISYVVVRLGLICLYVRAHIHERRARPLTSRFLLGFALGAVAWLASVWIESPGRYALWGLGMAVELCTPLISASAIKRVPFHASHIRERLGLFTLIVLGETIVLNTTRLVEDRPEAAALLVAAAGFLLVTGLWWIYFDSVDEAPLRQWIVAGQTYLYGHLFVFGGIAAAGVGILLASRAAVRPPLPDGGRWALCGGPAAFLFALGLIQLANARRWQDPVGWTRLASAAVAATLAGIDFGLSPFALEGLLVAGLGVEVLVERHIARGRFGRLRPGAGPAGRGVAPPSAPGDHESQNDDDGHQGRRWQ